MREILFRGKNIYNDWIYGYLCQHRGEPVMDNNGMVLEGSDYYIRDWAEKIDTGFYGCNYRVDPSTIGQYTGLTDKNGRKIFEGDIIHVNYTISVPVGAGPLLCIVKHSIDYKSVVAFDNCRFFLKKQNGEIFEMHLVPGEIEVIGNIHDNPELLEADK